MKRIVSVAIGSVLFITSSMRADISDLPPPPPLVAVAKPVENEIPAATVPSVVVAVATADATMPPAISTTPPVATAELATSAPVAIASAAPAVPAASVPAEPATGATAVALPVASTDHSSAKPAGTEVESLAGKDAYEKTVADRDAAQAALALLEKAKADSMDSYLAFDKELDDLYDQAGVARGSALADLADAKQQILDSLHAKDGADNESQKAISEQSTILDTLGKEIESLQEVEAKVVAALKTLSDYVLTLSEEMESINLNRMSLMTAVDQPSIVDLSAKIKKSADVIAAADKSANATGGQVAVYAAAVSSGKDKIAAINKTIEALKQKNMNIAEAVGKVAQRVKAGKEAKKKVDDHEVDKKKSKKMTNPVRDWVKGTVFEAPYEVVVVFWDALMPVRTVAKTAWSAAYQMVLSYWHGHDDKEMVADPLNDPVLERIRLERTQSHKKVKALQMQREVIEMKSTLLDRLEAERIMQLDTKEGISAEIGRAYARKDRELSWIDLFKRIAWKLYASLRRGVGMVIAWLHKDEEGSLVKTHRSDGVGEPKSEALVPGKPAA